MDLTINACDYYPDLDRQLEFIKNYRFYFLPIAFSTYFTHIILLNNIIQMHNDPSSKRQNIPAKANEPQIDQIRLNLYKMMDGSRQDDKQDEKVKKVINQNVFRESLRRQQREFHQHNHQFIKMSGIVSRSSRDESKFSYIGDNYRKVNKFAQGNTNQKNIQKKTAAVHLSLDTTQFNCALSSDKIPMKELYNLFPFSKQSIIFQAHDLLSPKYIFFLQENNSPVTDTLKHKLQNTIQQGVLSQFKNSINKAFKHVEFFDYLYFLNRRPKLQRQTSYPNYIQDIACANTDFLEKIDQDEKREYNSDQIQVIEKDTCERLIIGQETDVGDNGENLCFDTIQDYTSYKKHKEIYFKAHKILQKDAVINTNIRNIISTQKIYLVEIIEQVKSYILLSQQCQGTVIMEKVYQQLTGKADQYLRLLCGYTESKILTIYNIENYQEKIYSFIEKSIRYKKQVRHLPLSVIRDFPVLEIWYKLPENLLGYSRQELHETLYQLLEAIIIFEKKIREAEFYESLKIKRPAVKYVL